MKRQIVGYRKFTSKNGSKCCAVAVTYEGKAKEGIERVGLECDTVMLFKDNVDVITPDSIGKTLGGYFFYDNGGCVCQKAEVVG